MAGESRAGHPADRRLGAGEAIAISTGAMVPDGADAVVRVEDTDGGAETVAVRVEVGPGNDIRRAGEDIAAGETVLRGRDARSGRRRPACSPRSGAPRSPARAGRG